VTPPTPPAFRLKIPCEDERDFRARFAAKYATAGIFVPSNDPKPVGTRVRVRLEFRGGQVLVSGDGMVTGRKAPEGPEKPGMTIRLTALDPTSIQFELSPTAHPALTPSPPPAVQTATQSPTLDDLFDFAEDGPPHAAPANAAQAPSVEGPYLSEIEQTPSPAPVRPPTSVSGAVSPPEPPAAPPLPDLLAEPEDAPTEPSASIPGPVRAAPRSSRRPLVLLGIAIGLALVVAGATAVWARARDRGATATGAATKLAETLRLADARIASGRLAGAGGDTALDHLVAARGLSPGDARVTARLGLLAEKFEQLGDHALRRKNLAEARIHYESALRAEPGREGARRALSEIGR
jgi:hypothetical protein